MPFGRYKGRTLDELPDDYLTWLLTVARPLLRAAVQEELERRSAQTNVWDKPPLTRQNETGICELRDALKEVMAGISQNGPRDNAT